MPKSQDAETVSYAPPPLSSAQRRWQIQVLIATYFSYIGYYFCRKSYSLCKSAIADTFQLDEATKAQQLAFPWMLYLMAYMVGQFINGAMGRKLGSRLLLLMGMGGTFCCCVGFGFANDMRAFAWLMVLNGLFQSSGWPGNVGAVAPWIRRPERGRVMGLWTTNYSFGSMAVKGFTSFMLGFSIAGFAVWQGAFWACSGVMLVIWVMFLLLQRNKPEDVGLPPIVTEESELDQALGRGSESSSGGPRAGFFKILFTPTVLMMGVTYFCFKFVRYAIDSWLPYVFKNKFPELSYGESGYYSLVFDLMGIAGGIVAGWALDRLFGGRWRSVCLTMVLGMLGAFLSVYVLGGISPIVLSVLTGLVGFMLFGPDTIISGAASVDIGGKEEAVAAAGIINGIGSMGPIVQEPLIGWMLDTFPEKRLTSVTILFISMSTVATLLIGLLWWRERRRLRLDSLGGGI